MSTIFSSEVAITLYVTVVLFVWRWLRNRYAWKTERWEGLIAAAFNVAEKTQLKTGAEKLDRALRAFARLYQETWQREPGLGELRDAALAFARMAYDAKFAPRADVIEVDTDA